MQKRRETGQQKWVSHNKVLIGSGDGGGNKKPHARNPNFDSEETKLLIQLWGDPQVQRTLITVHKKHPVISRIADKMRAYGYNRSTEEINTRIKNLKCLYNRIKKDLDSGLLNESSWKHYNAMHEILSRPVFGNSSSSTPAATTATSKPSPGGTKIVISPASANDSSDHSLFQVKQEEMSEDDDANDSMDFDGSELRPEDLLSVIETEHDIDDVDIKEEPMETTTINEFKAPEENEKFDASPAPKDGTAIASNSAVNIVNYANDSLSITSVQGNANSSEPPPMTSPKVISSQTGNKISLVPTKLLLKPQAVNGFKQTSHIIASSNITTTTTHQPATITSNAQNSIPMKVVFVNALNNAQQASKQHLTLNKTLTQQLQTQAATANPTFITNKILTTAGQQKVQLVNQISSPITATPKVNTSTISVHNTSNNSNHNSSSTSNISSIAGISVKSHHHHHQSSGKSKTLLGNKLPVIRSLLTNIVEIENQRLEIEKQRFEYEKKVGTELLSLLKTFVQSKSTHDDTNQLKEASIEKE